MRAALSVIAGVTALVLSGLLAGCSSRPKLGMSAPVAGAADAHWLLGDSLLAIGLNGRGVVILDAEAGTELARWQLPSVPPEPAFGLAASATGETLAVACSDSVRVFRTRGLTLLRASAGRAVALALSGDGSELGWSDGSLGRVIDVKSGERTAEGAVTAGRNALRWMSSNGFAWPEGRQIRCEHGREGAGLTLGPFLDGLPRLLATSTLGSTLAVAESTDHVSFWDTHARAMRWRLRLPGPASFHDMALSGDTWYLATTRHDRTRLLWAYTGREVASWKPHDGAQVRAMAFAQGGRKLATVGAEGRVHVWSVPEPKQGRR